MRPARVRRRGCSPSGRAGSAPSGRRWRRAPDADYLFLIDHSGAGAEIPAHGVELLTGKSVHGSVTVPDGGLAVVREPRRP
ncbi:Beta-galactosidase C-terminal domain [Streptomyces cyaneus]|uniref:Beta-galactosidase C-terminal domain n=1 Tax=Streptomyces cyaneus TaxID=1904 RepID=UPI00319DAA0E